jgi:hypothetical protein
VGQFELGGQVRVLVDAWKGAARVDLRQVRAAIEWQCGPLSDRSGGADR